LLKLEIKKITTEYKANIPAFDVAVYIKIVWLNTFLVLCLSHQPVQVVSGDNARARRRV
jgi:hypothetical protein